MAESVGNKTRLTIVTPYEHFYDGMVDSCVLPVEDGDLGIMYGHSPIIAGIVPGLSHITVDGETKYFILAEGYAQIDKNQVLVICDSAEYPEKLTANRVITSYQYFTDLLNVPGNENSNDLKIGLRRAIVRMKAIERFGSPERKETLKQLKKENNIK